MAANSHQLLLLADHIKLSLLERQRAKSLSLDHSKQDTSIRRSLESLREGVESLERQKFDQEAAGENISELADQIFRLRSQYSELDSEYQSDNADGTSIAATSPNDQSLSPDFSKAQSRPSTRGPQSSSIRKASANNNKAVRFRDDPSASEPAYRDTSPDPASRAALFDRPYTDEEPGAVDQSKLDNVQIHAYHKQAIRDQDEQLDALGASIGRQRDLSIQMGDELDDQAGLIEDLDRGVDRHQSTLDRAKDRLGKVSRRAKDNWSWVTIACLILVLVLLIVLVK